MEPVVTSDAVLWREAAAGSPGAFGALFERHADAVYNHCFRRTASWSAAEDLTSVVFLEAWRRRNEVVLTSDSILPWLLAVANNAIRNADRAMRRHRRLLAKLPWDVATPDPADDAAGRIDDERFMHGVLLAFEQLNPGEQDVLALCGWAGLSYGDAAVALGVPVGTVRSRLSRARAHLRRLVTAPADGPATPAAGRPSDPPADPAGSRSLAARRVPQTVPSREGRSR
jgi:RNA polymerase sigma-70 factor (ECF subfamily)